MIAAGLLLLSAAPGGAKVGGATIPEWATQELALLDTVRAWVAAASERQRDVPFGRAASDEANFMASWFGYYHLTGDPLVLETAESLFGSFEEWLRTQGHLGYYPKQEAHHGTEPFIFFPTRLYQTGRQQDRLVEVYRQVAEHCGNWSEGVPDWYDWDQHLFRSYYLGTRTVLAEEAPGNNPDHFRFLQILLAAHRMTGEERFLALATDYADRWAREILAAEAGFPTILPADRPPGDHAHLARSNEAQASGDLAAQIEWHVAGGSLDTFLDLYRLCRKPEYAEAAKRAIPVLLETAREPWGHPAAALIGKYRDFTGDRSLDRTIRRELLGVAETVSDEIRGVRLPGPKVHPLGIGQRFDMVVWEYQQADGTWARDTGLSPPALALLYQVTGDRRHAALAMRKAGQRLRWAVANLKDGREHADAGWCIAAVAGGHGRNYGWGELTGALYPLALGSWNSCGEDLLGVRYTHDGETGLPRGVAALYEPAERPRVMLVNTTERQAATEVALTGRTAQSVALEAGQARAVRATPAR